MIEFNVPWHGYIIVATAGATFNPVVDVVIAHTEHDSFLGGVVYYNYTGASISMHVASFAPNWLSKDLLWVAFHYPFVQLGCKKIVTTIPSYNLKSLAFNKRLGFKEEAVISDVFPNGNAVVTGMRREDCRWLDIKPKSIREGSSRSGWEASSPGSAGLYADNEGTAGAG